MSSGVYNKYNDSFTGAAAEVAITKVPFRPRSIKFWATGGVWGVKFEGLAGMADATYLSNTAEDEGVTITDTGFTVDSGADVNVNGETVYYECEG